MEQKEMLQEISNKLDVLITWKEVHETSHTFVTRDLSELRADMYGNGRDGVKQTVQKIALNCQNVRHARAFWEGVAKSVIASLLVAFVGWLLFLYVHHQKEPSISSTTQQPQAENSNVSYVEGVKQ